MEDYELKLNSFSHIEDSAKQTIVAISRSGDSRNEESIFREIEWTVRRANKEACDEFLHGLWILSKV